MGDLRLRFWLAAIGVADRVNAPLPVYLWLVERASDAIDWTPGATCGEGDPF